MRSTTSIVNDAMALLGCDPISSINDPSRRAILARREWETVYKQVLSEHSWNFATGRSTLAALAVTPAFGYAYAYALPQDFLAFSQLDDIETDFRLETIDFDGVPVKAMMSNDGQVNLIYVRNISDVTVWDDPMAAAVAACLAAKLAKQLTGSNDLAKTLDGKYREILANAAFRDASQSPTQTIGGSTWLDARRRNGQNEFHRRPLRPV